MKANVIVSRFNEVHKFSISKLDIQQVQGLCKLAEKLNETQGSIFPTILVKVTHDK